MEEKDFLNENDPYIILGVNRDADKTEIKKAYVKLIKKYKPENYPDEFKKIREAYDTALSWQESSYYSYNLSIDYEKEKENLDLQSGFINSDNNDNTNDPLLENDSITIPDKINITDESYEEILIYKRRIKAGERFIIAASNLYEAILEDPDSLSIIDKLLTDEELDLFIDEYPLPWEILSEVSDRELAISFFQKSIYESFIKGQYLEIIDMFFSESIIETAKEDDQFNDFVLNILSSLMLYLPEEVNQIVAFFKVTDKYHDPFYYTRPAKGWMLFKERHPDSIIFQLIHNTVLAPLDLIKDNFKKLFEQMESNPKQILEQCDHLKKYDMLFYLDNLLNHCVKNQTLSSSINVEKKDIDLIRLSRLLEGERMLLRIMSFSISSYMIYRFFTVDEFSWKSFILPASLLFIVMIIIYYMASRKKYMKQRSKILKYFIDCNITPKYILTELIKIININSELLKRIGDSKDYLVNDRSMEFLCKLNLHRSYFDEADQKI